jgi:hypothetical protein
MNDQETKYLLYIQEQEGTDVSFVKVGDGHKNLIVSFGCANPHGGFDRKKSLMKLMSEDGDTDVLYLRDMKEFQVGRGRHKHIKLLGRWYLGGLTGIGKNIIHTISFLKNIFKNYENVICTGTSMGGYASILFGSLLNVNYVIVGNAQTDLGYVLEHTRRHGRGKISQLSKRKKECPKTWEKYSNLDTFVSESVNYQLYYTGESDYIGNRAMGGYNEAILHSTHHLDNIKNCKSVTEFDSDIRYSNFIEKISSCLI